MVRCLLRTGIVLACLAVLGVAAGPASAASAAPRIVGGSDTTIDQHPWQVALFYDTGSSLGQFCGGVILDPWHVLTAAHCVLASKTQLEPASRIFVLAGATNAVSDPGQLVGAAKLEAMPSYGSPKEDSHDAGLITLSSPLTFDSDVGKATVTPTGGLATPLAKDDPLVVTGWGATTPTGNDGGSEILQETTVGYVPDGDCEAAFADPLVGADFEGETMLCAITPDQDSCFGDSGGPLTTPAPDPVLVGLVSWGPETCGGAEGPGVYTDLAETALNNFARGPHIVGLDGPQRAAPGDQASFVAVVGDNDTPDSGLHFTWDLDGDGQYDDADTGSAQNVSTTLPATAGNVTIGVRVADDLTSDTAQRTVSLAVPAPPVNTNPTVPPAPTEPAPKPDVTGPKVVVRSITRAGSRAAVRLGCPGESACHGVITLRTTRKVRTNSGRRTIAVGRAEFRLGWQDGVVRVKLSGIARRLLAHGNLRVTVTVVAFDAAGNTTRKLARGTLRRR